MRKIDELAQWLRERDHIVILTHVHPDGDALGSTSAICMALQKMGKQAVCVCDDPVPSDLAFLPVSAVQPEQLPFAPRWALLCDAGDAGRAGRSGKLLDQVQGASTLDHHGTSRGVGDICIIEPKSSATGVLVLELIRSLGVSLDRDMAACLYAAITTDTGNFAFSNTNPDALRAVADCLETGLDAEDMNYRLFRARRMQKTRLIGAALYDMEFLRDGRVALIQITREKMARCGASGEDIDTIVNFGMDTKGVAVSVLLEERGSTVKVSLRSRGELDVSALAARLGGGGHKNAAGATLDLSIGEAAMRVTGMIDEMLK